MRYVFFITYLFVSQCLIAGTNDSLKNFSTFSDCRLSIDILAKDFSTIGQRDTLDRLNHIIVVCQKIDARGKSLESLSSLGISDDKLKCFLVVEWCSDTLPYSAIYCGEEIYFIKINHAGEVFVQHFVNKNLIRNVESIKTIISEYQNYGDLSLSGRGSVFWFITDFQINKSIVIHDVAMRLSLHGKRGAGSIKLQKIYDECLSLIDNIGIKRY